METLKITKSTDVDRILFEIEYRKLIYSIQESFKATTGATYHVDRLLSEITGKRVSIRLVEVNDEIDTYLLKIGRREIETIISVNDLDLDDVDDLASFIKGCANQVRITSSAYETRFSAEILV